MEVRQLRDCLRVPYNVQWKLWQQRVNDEEHRNELISWWLQYSPYALDSWKWLSGQLLYGGKVNALAAAKRYIHQTPGMSMVNYRHAHIPVYAKPSLLPDDFRYAVAELNIIWRPRLWSTCMTKKV